MSNTNRVAIRAAVEASFGIVPTAPEMRDLCITGAPSLAFTPETTVSEKIRSDRQIDDLPLVGGEAGGDINSELAFSAHDYLLEGAFFNAFQIRNTRTNDEGTTEITAATGTEFTVLTGDVPVVDDIVRGEGFDVAANNAYHVIDGVPSATQFTTATATAETTPPNQARLTTVGRRGGAGDLVLTIGGTNSLASTLLDFTTLGLQAGDWIALDAIPLQPTSEGFYRISIAPTATLLTFDVVPTGAVSDTPAGDMDIYMGERLTNGITFQSYTLEEEFTDHSPVTFQYFRGMTVDGMVLTAPSQAIVGIVFTFSGKDAFYSDTGIPATVPDQLPAVDGPTARVGSATTITQLPINVLNSSSNVARISRGGVPITGSNFVLEASVEIANNLRQLTAVGFLGAVDIGDGEFGVTGSLNTYFDDASLARDVVSNAETSFDMRFVDADNHTIVIDVPRIKFSEGAPDVPSKNEDVTIALAYQAIREPVFDYTLLWQRFTGFQKSN